MSLAQILSTYLTLNIIIALGYVTLRLFKFILEKAGTPSSRSELKIHYFVLGAIIVVTTVHPFLPKKTIFEPAAKVWSAQSIKDFPSNYSTPDKGGYLSLPTPKGISTFDANRVAVTLSFISLMVLLAGLFRLGRDLLALIRIRKKSYLARKVGHVSVFINDEITVPFSYWVPGQSNVVIPNSLMASSDDYKMAVAHELQHHRQADTRWVYIMWAFKIVCVLNPFIYLWNRWLSEIQEFACDETLVDRNKVESRQYARCLIEVAQTALNQKYVPACATGLTFLVERNLLKRRIDKMVSKSTKIKRSISWSIGGLLVALITATAFASQGLVQDRRVTLAGAQKLAVNSKSKSDFPVVVNDLVLKQLNRYIGTPEGREFMRNALSRMGNYQALIENKIEEYQVPIELMAIPIIESGYQNLEQSNNQGWGAGIWMFIASTARTYGLRVDNQLDERLNVDLLTDAAMRYLKGDKLKFKDWLLSVLSYNMGERKVLEAIKKTGSRDAWVLVRNGYENDKDYLPKLMAAILIMRNPETVE